MSSSEIEAASSVLASQWAGFGNIVNTFEDKFSEKQGVPNFLLVDSGSNALFLAVRLLDLPKNSEIILPSFTWVACAQAVAMAGLRPVFCDVDLITMNVSAADIEEKITPNTSAIMIVHYAGLCVDVDSLREFGLPIIEDAAHAVSSKLRQQPAGTLGDIGIFSFDAVKNLSMVEGGGMSFRNPELYTRAKSLRYCGMGKSGFDSAANSTGNDERPWWEYNIGYNSIKALPNNLHAAIGLVQLSRLDELQARRKQIWDYYIERLTGHPEIHLPVGCEDPHSAHSYFTFCIRCSKRDSLAKYLLARNIYTTLRYHPLHMNEIFADGSSSLKNTEILNKEALSIPLHPRLTDFECEEVVSAILAFYKD